MSKGSTFESELTKGFNDMLRKNDLRGIAYRHYEFKLHEQLFDILVDSADRRFYAAIECKTMDYSNRTTLYFSHAFKTTTKGHQIQRETDFLWESGRNGILAVELRNTPERKRIAVLIPWKILLDEYTVGRKGLDLSDYSQYEKIRHYKGSYLIDPEQVISMINRRKGE